MDKLQVSFAGLLVLALALGALTAFDTSSYYQAIDAKDQVRGEVSLTVTDVELREDRFAVTAEVRNPTRTDLEITGSRIRVFNESNARIAASAGIREDDGGSTLAAGESLSLTYTIPVSSSERSNLRGALREDASVSMNLGMRLGDATFVVRTSDPVEEGALS